MRRRFVATLFSVFALVLASAEAKAAPNRAPVVIAFDVPEASASPILVAVFDATDSDGTIAGYLISETSTKPSATAAGWSATKPAQYATASVGAITLYAWVKDNAGAVSNSLSRGVSVPPPPVNADTLDQKHAIDFAAVSHTHPQGDVTGLTDAIDGKAAAVHGHNMNDVNDLGGAMAQKAEANHTHDFSYRRYAQVISVAISGGDFLDPVSAMESILDASPEKRYLLKIMPGTYNLGQSVLEMQSFVDIEGSGENVTRIVGTSDAVPYVLKGASSAELRSLTVENWPLRDLAGHYSVVMNSYASPTLMNVTIINTGMGQQRLYGITNENSDPVLKNATIVAEGGTLAWGIKNSASSPVMKDVNITVTDCFDCKGVLSSSGRVLMSDSTITMSDGVGVFFDSQSEGGTLNNVQIGLSGNGPYSAYNHGVYVYAVNAPPVLIDRCSIDVGVGSAITIFGDNSVKLGASKINGPVNLSNYPVTPPPVCVSCYDGNYGPLNSTCQP